MHEFIQGLILGLGVAIPIGPINILMMNYALKSYTQALALASGAMLADLSFLVISTFGISHIVIRPALFKLVAIFGSLFLLYMAYNIFKNARRKITTSKIPNENKISTFFKGLMLNALNPFVIMFWISVSATTAKLGENFTSALLGVFLVLLLWITLFPLTIYKSRTFIKPHISALLSYISSIILVFFSIHLIYKTFNM